MHCFKAFDAIFGRHGFEKLKTMGDVYIAIAGIPKASALDASSGIDAALEIRQFLADLNESRRAAGRLVLEARIAVHTGRVVGGIVKTEKMSYDVWGSTVKVLLRLLQEARRGQVLVSDATRRLAGEGFMSTCAGKLDEGVGADIVFYDVERDAA
jgi:class 3 adenylate cyclase